MKKVITLILIFVMILSCTALAEPEYIGAWTAFLDAGAITAFRLLPDHTAYYLAQSFPDETPVSGVYSWEEIDDRSFRIFDAQGESVGEYSMLNKNRIVDKNSVIYANTLISVPLDQIVFDSEPEPDPTEVPAPAGITVPSGVYIAGEDFPAGTYRIVLENEKNSGVIVLYENMEDTKKAFSYLHEYILDKNNHTVGKMIIDDGNVLDVRNTVIVLLPYEGLK